MENNQKEQPKKKGFFKALFEKLDKKMEEKSKNSGCCCSKDKQGDNSCCN